MSSDNAAIGPSEKPVEASPVACKKPSKGFVNAALRRAKDAEAAGDNEAATVIVDVPAMTNRALLRARNTTVACFAKGSAEQFEGAIEKVASLVANLIEAELRERDVARITKVLLVSDGATRPAPKEAARRASPKEMRSLNAAIRSLVSGSTSHGVVAAGNAVLARLTFIPRRIKYAIEVAAMRLVKKAHKDLQLDLLEPQPGYEADDVIVHFVNGKTGAYDVISSDYDYAWRCNANLRSLGAIQNPNAVITGKRRPLFRIPYSKWRVLYVNAILYFF